jgi:hypothetical protein
VPVINPTRYVCCLLEECNVILISVTLNYKYFFGIFETGSYGQGIEYGLSQINNKLDIVK